MKNIKPSSSVAKMETAVVFLFKDNPKYVPELSMFFCSCCTMTLLMFTAVKQLETFG